MKSNLWYQNIYFLRVMRVLFVFCLLLVLTKQIPQICTGPTLQAKFLKSNPPLSDIDKTRICFSSLIEKGEYQSIDSLEHLLEDSEQKIMTELLNAEIMRLESIQQYVIQTKSTCEPVLKWAQNLSHIFVAVKLSHRWDSPPCLKTVEESYDLKNSTLFFNNVCLVSNTRITFGISSKLYKNCTRLLQIKKDGVGTYSLTIEKQEHQLWPYLLETNEKVQIWHELMARNQTLKTQFQKLVQKTDAINAASSKSDI